MAEPVTSDDGAIITTLRERQGEAQLTDAAMAARLGISRTYWLRLVAGERRLTVRVLRGALAAYPDLFPAAVDFLRSN